MKRWVLAGLLLLAVMTTWYSLMGKRLPKRTSVDRVLVDEHAVNAYWSLDSRYLFYQKHKIDRYVRYDVVTGERHVYGLLDPFDPIFHCPFVSPDGTSSVSIQERGSMTRRGPWEFELLHRSTQKRSTIFRSSFDIYPIIWTRRGLLYSPAEPSSAGIFLLSLSHGSAVGKPVELVSDGHLRMAASDHSGFLYYTRKSPHYHYYNWNTRRSKGLNVPEGANFLYVTGHKVVYWVVSNPARWQGMLLHLDTLRSELIALPRISDAASISPNGTLCWTSIQSYDHLNPKDRLYVMRVPKATVERLSQPTASTSRPHE